jgi:hypothetical protein
MAASEHHPTTDDVEARLRALEDERAVLGTIQRYGEALDYGDEVGWADCFTENGVFEVRDPENDQPVLRVTGRSALVAFAQRHTRAPELWHKHIAVNPTVTLDGDRASARSYMLLLVEIDDRPAVAVFGRYHDRLERTGAGWVFSERIAMIESRHERTPRIVGGHQPAAGGTA